MRIGLITDTHWGVRNDNQTILNSNKKFLDEIFFPTLAKENVSTLVHLGDLVDRRRYINFYTAHRLRQDFIEPILQKGLDFHWILGNHDLHFRHDMSVSAASELPYNLKYYINPEEIIFGSEKILFVPWICDENREKTYDLINTTEAKILFGHLELQGFEMFRGIISHHGENPNIFSKFDVVCSGHYHHKSSVGNINYLGAHSEFTWADYADDRGFHIFDTESKKLIFYQNPFNLFAKVFYDDAKEEKFDFTSLNEKFVKIVVTNRNNTAKYEWFLNQVEEAQPIEYSIVEDHLNLDLIEDSSIINESQDTLTLMRNYAKSVNNAVDIVKLDSLFVKLYDLAQASE